jgi:hypothetical protein
VSAIHETWIALSPEQRIAGVAALLLIVSTFGPFSFVEAAIVLVALAVLLLLRRRAEGRLFHLPFGDGTVIAAAGAWCGLLIVIRLFDRPLGQGLLALGCAALMAAAGIRERAKRPADDLPQTRAPEAKARAQGEGPTRAQGEGWRWEPPVPPSPPAPDQEATRPLADQEATRPPPEREPPASSSP